MKDESSSSSPARIHLPSAEIQPTKPTDRRPICPLLDLCYRLTEGQLKPPRLQFSPCSSCSRSIDRHQRRSFSEASALRPCASPPRLMDNSTANMDKAILSSLKTRTKSWSSSTKKLPTDAEVMKLVLSDVGQAFRLNLALLKDRIKKYESMVQKHLDSGEDIVENKDMLLKVFSYLRLSKHRGGKLIRPQSSSSEKRSRDEHDDSAYLEHAKKATYSESVGKQSTGLGSAQNETEKSAIVMEEVSKKLEKSLGSGLLLYAGLDLVKEDLTVRWTVYGLSDREAGNYIEHGLSK